VVGLNKKILDAVKKNGGVHRCLVHCCRVPNGCIWPIFGPEMSHRGMGAEGWGMGRDSISSTQSKRAGGGETAHLWLS
jgi:hypothetical protein